jgi:hypothetical protein
MIMDGDDDVIECDFEFTPEVKITDEKITEKNSGIASDNTKILVEITQPKEFFSSRLRQDLDRLIAIAIDRKYKPGYVWHKIKDKHGLTKANSCRGEIQRRLGVFDKLRADSAAIAEAIDKVKAGLRSHT